jgi:RimJ/RimL family protein N-acetyltransferase
MAEIEPRRFNLKTSEPCLVRSAEERDAAAILANAREMLTAPFLVTTPEEFDLTEEQERAWIAEHRQKPGWLALVPEVEGQIVGLLNFENGARRRLAHRGSFGMSVLATWRGRGVGDALLTSLLEWARESPLIEKVCLSVFVENDRALRLYRKHGFVEEGRRVREIKHGPGMYADDFIMSRLVK